MIDVRDYCTNNEIIIKNYSKFIDQPQEPAAYLDYFIDDSASNNTTITTDGTEEIIGKDDARLYIFIEFKGSGTSDDPYQIWKGYELTAIPDPLAAGLYYKLMDDIDLTGVTYYPISVYGTFDGNNKSISNLSITKIANTFVGLFKFVYGEVKDVNMVDQNIYISGYNSSGYYFYVGSIAGALVSGGTISGCTSNATLEACNLYQDVLVGGIVGILEDATIDNCTFSGTVNHSANQTMETVSAGIAAYVSDYDQSINNTITNCVFNGFVSGTTVDYIYNGDDSDIIESGNDCSTGTVTQK